MARDLRVLSASVQRPDERSVYPVEARTGPYIGLIVVSEDLKTKPVHTLRLSEDEALRIAEQLVSSVINLRRSAPPA